MPTNGEMDIRLVLGLGNIGARYDGTRHNVGFEVVDLLAAELKARKVESAGPVEVLTAQRGDREIILASPLTYMNRSGVAADALLQANDLVADQMLVVVDDFNLPLGRLRLRPSGSDGGHNGLASLIETVGESFPRLRLGIGPAPDGVNTADFVLAAFSPEERKEKSAMIKTAAEAVLFTIDHRFDEAMSKYNANPAR